MQPATYRIRLAWLSAILMALILSMGAQTAQAQKGRPLNEQDVLELLQGGVPSARVTAIVSDRGVAFALTSGSEQRIRSAGGGNDLVEALRRLAKRTEEPETPRGGSLRIQTTPGEAQVYINDEPKGITSPEGEIRFSSLKSGTYSVRVSLLGYQSWENTITITAGENQTIPVTLTQKARVSPPVRTEPVTTPPVQPTYPVAPQASGIPVPGLKPPVVQFYEGPHDKTPKHDERVYKFSFDKASTRSVYWEVDLSYPHPSQQIDFKLTAHWIKPDGSEMGQQTLDDAHVLPEWTTSWHTLGWGWVDAGHWGLGNYRVDFYAGGALVASGSFQITGAGRSR